MKFFFFCIVSALLIIAVLAQPQKHSNIPQERFFLTKSNKRFSHHNHFHTIPLICLVPLEHERLSSLFLALCIYTLYPSRIQCNTNTHTHSSSLNLLSSSSWHRPSLAPPPPRHRPPYTITTPRRPLLPPHGPDGSCARPPCGLKKRKNSKG